MKIKRTLGKIGNYKIIMTGHACQRAKQRNIDPMKILSTILGFGTKKVDEYANNNTDIMIKDLENNISIIFAVAKNKITIITVIHDTDVYIKNYPDTIINEI